MKVFFKKEQKQKVLRRYPNRMKKQLLKMSSFHFSLLCTMQETYQNFLSPFCEVQTDLLIE